MSVKSPVTSQAGTMSIAIPLAHNRFAPHFGSAEEWMIFEGNPREKSLGYAKMMPSPEHKPGSLPAFLAAQHVDAVIASSIGERALLMLADAGIITYIADHSPEPVDLAKACLLGTLARAHQGNSGCKGECQDHHGHPAHQH